MKPSLNAIILSSFFLAQIFISCTNDVEYEELTLVKENAHFVGSESCKECHLSAYNEWKGSHHERAMDTAIAKTVKGDFNNAVFKGEDGFESRFYKRDGKFYVFTKGENGIAKEMRIDYVFGITPLQQYLIETKKGRLQCLPIAWDDQTNSYYSMLETVYHGHKIESDDWLYWTNNGQNWNGMCAECHTTNYHKGYDLSSKSFNTTYSEINVGCESCHGPASIHNEWASVDEKERKEIENYGLLNKTYGLNSEEFINQCGYCHARRTSYGDFDHEDDHFMNHWTPQLLHENYYHSDGQILEEDYVVGSFMQSKMYRRNVRCVDCHNAHSLETRFKGNTLCYQCHIPDDYEEKHHFHKKTGGEGKATVNGFYDNERGDGTQCVDCHMAGQNFMGVDFRRDHSMRVPRPDLSIRNGTPNACNQCHNDKSNEWSVKAIEKWYGKKIEHENTEMYNAFADARKGDTSAIGRLYTHVLKQDSVNNIYKATALGYLNTFRSEEAQNIIAKYLKDESPLIRQTAVNYYYTEDESELKKRLAPLLSDSIKAIRLAVLNRVSLFPNLKFDPRYDIIYDKALNEYKESMLYTSDFAASLYNLANLSIKSGNDNEAINYFYESLDVDNRFLPSSISLSILLSRNGRNGEAIDVLNNAVSKNPASVDALYYLGLLYAEEGRLDLSIKFLEEAIKIDSNNHRINYNLSLLYQKTGDFENAERHALEALENAQGNDLYKYSLAIIYLNSNQPEKAIKVAAEMKKLFPESEYTKQIIEIVTNL